MTMCYSPRSSLFPYTTLFRSADRLDRGLARGVEHPNGQSARLRVPVPGDGGGRHDRDARRRRQERERAGERSEDRKSTRLNSSHRCISYAVFRSKKKTSATTI